MARPSVKVPKLDIDTELLTPDTLTLGEAAALEKALGQRWSAIDKESVDTLIALVWLSARRHNLALTLDDIRGITFSEIELNVGDDGDASDPSPAADPASAEDGDPTPSTTESAGTASA